MERERNSVNDGGEKKNERVANEKLTKTQLKNVLIGQIHFGTFTSILQVYLAGVCVCLAASNCSFFSTFFFFRSSLYCYTIVWLIFFFISTCVNGSLFNHSNVWDTEGIQERSKTSWYFSLPFAPEIVLSKLFVSLCICAKMWSNSSLDRMKKNDPHMWVCAGKEHFHGEHGICVCVCVESVMCDLGFKVTITAYVLKSTLTFIFFNLCLNFIVSHIFFHPKKKIVLMFSIYVEHFLRSIPLVEKIQQPLWRRKKKRCLLQNLTRKIKTHYMNNSRTAIAIESISGGTWGNFGYEWKKNFSSKEIDGQG